MREYHVDVFEHEIHHLGDAYLLDRLRDDITEVPEIGLFLHGHREFGDDVLPDRIGEYD
jgi:hypothetical protein